MATYLNNCMKCGVSEESNHPWNICMNCVGKSFRKYKVTADSVEDFCDRFYKRDRYHDRGEEYMNIVLKGNKKDFDEHGWIIISHWDSVTGEIVAYFKE